MKKFFAFLMGSAVLTAQGAEPGNYYSSCEGKSGAALLESLCAIVGPHTDVGYAGLWEVYESSDIHPDGSVWDMYSTKEWGVDYTRCGNYKNVGDCINREHSFPKSWFNDHSPMVSDAFHIYPTDGKVNGQRSNYPYGECSGGTTIAYGDIRGLGRLGTSTFAGYSGKVFEPDDQYKGDFARSYFYMAAAYNDRIATWNSDMLAGNSYPAFTPWAVELLLKWHRQDPVSSKEIDRNEAVSQYQQNRNPFIDHPEMAEYIWGNRSSLPWSADAGNEPVIVAPADGLTIAMGMASVGVSRVHEVYVKGSCLDDDVYVSVSGTGFSATPALLDMSDVNSSEGARLTLRYMPAEAGDATGTLTLESGSARSVATIICTAVEGLPAGGTTDISDESFVARWSCIDGAESTYTLDVMWQGVSIDGYPRAVRAADEQALVSGLQPSTTYTYTVSSATLTSAPVTVVTADPIPSVDLLYDGDLEFAAMPGEPSDIAEILMDIENIAGDISVAVASPFELSSDKASWSRRLTVEPGEDRFYMRLLSEAEGTYTTSITISADDYFNDDVEVTGTVSATTCSFHEDFEVRAEGAGSYNDKNYQGSASLWNTNALFEAGGSNSYPHQGEQAARTPKSGGYLTMLESKQNGAGTVSVWARLWKTDTTPSVWSLLISGDDGVTWEQAGEISVLPNGSVTEYDEYTVEVNRKGAVRIKLSQISGARTFFDDIRITDCRTSGIEAANEAEYHSWDAFCRGGQLILQSNGTTADVATVYSIDGTELHHSLLRAGETALTLAPGLYIVVVRDFARRVLVK